MGTPIIVVKIEPDPKPITRPSRQRYIVKVDMNGNIVGTWEKRGT